MCRLHLLLCTLNYKRGQMGDQLGGLSRCGSHSLTHPVETPLLWWVIVKLSHVFGRCRVTHRQQP